MARASGTIAIVAAACALALGACSKQVDTNANAPGSPGSGNTAEVVRPAAPDSPPGGPSGIAGSQPHPGSSGGDAVVGASGTGTAGASQQAMPGQGLDGGLGTDNAALAASSPAGSGTAMGAGGTALDGSPNTTTQSSVGNRH
ncbi:MAG TPA: hypothetical protein VFM98_21005 [Ramlibacter sp.]|uniref:hypothetical protein n=1 Tax=Ramlibacter sp. TaxID=1917967 RepID=UPI002D7E8AB7|nr:hypothetical protein [Ramlibacter sp.]HET8748089.1 hypothetical protein [Ramlibacter sp.]